MAILVSQAAQGATYTLGSSDAIDTFFGSSNQAETLTYHGTGNLEFKDVSSGDRVNLNIASTGWQAKVVGNTVTLVNAGRTITLGALAAGENVTVGFSDGKTLGLSAALVGSSTHYTATPSEGAASTLTAVPQQVFTPLQQTFTPKTGTSTGSSDASTAIALDNRYMVVGDDEANVLRVYDRAGGEAVAEWDYVANGPLLTTGELDLEASTRIGDTLYFTGSHSNKKDGTEANNREFLFAVTVAGTGADTQFTYTTGNQTSALEAALVAWDSGNVHQKGTNYFGFATGSADKVVPETTGGFSIEGLTASLDGQSLLLGFRAPQSDTSVREKAVLVPVTVASLFTGAPVFGIPIELNLGGRGIRSIEKAADGSGYLIVAGPAGSASAAVTHDFRLFTWNGTGNTVTEIDTPLDVLRDLTGGSFETLVDVPTTQAGTFVQLLQDNGDTVWSGQSAVSKDLPPALQKFQGNWVQLGGAATDAAPMLVSSTPANGTVGAAADGNFVLTFNEAVLRGNGAITLKKADGTVVETFDAASAQVTVQFNTVTINPTQDLDYQSAYTLSLAPNAITDLAGNPAGVLSTDAPLSITTSAAPTPLSAGDLLFVGGNAEAPDAVAFVLLKAINGGTRIAFTDRDYSGTTGFAGITNETAYVWTADQDYAVGTVVTLQTDTTGSPIADKGSVLGSAGGIGKTETIYAMQGTQIAGLGNGTAGEITHAGTFLASLTLGGAAGTIPQTLTDAGAALAFTVNPTNQTNARYIGSLDASEPAALAARIKDTANWEANYTKAPGFPLVEGSLLGAPLLRSAEINGNTVTLQWNQVLDASNPPTADSFMVSVNGAVVAVNQVAITGDQLTLTLASAAKGGDTVTLGYTDPSAGNDTAAIQLPNGNDAASLVNITLVNRSPDGTAPTLVSTTPSDNATGFARFSDLVLSFNEPMAKGTGNITFKGLDGAADVVLDVTSAAVTVSGNTVTINPAAVLEASKAYAVQIDAGALTDVAGNAFTGIANTDTLNFTTAAVPSYSLLVTEVNSNGTGGDFFELYNHGSTAIDLSGWKWTDNQSSFTGSAAVSFANGTTIAAGQKLVVVQGTDAAAFRTAWNLPAEVGTVAVGGPGLGKGDAVVVFDAQGYVASAFNYGATALTASDGSTLSTANASADTRFSASQHAGTAFNGGTAADAKSAVWDGLSVTTPTYTVAVAGSNGAYAQTGAATSIGSPGAVPAPTPSNPEWTLLSAIQGSGDASPLVNQTVSVQARVTAWKPDLKTFFIEEEMAHRDADATTSEGIAVYYGNATSPVTADSIGDVVSLTATVTEFNGLTQLNNPINFTIHTDGTAASLDPVTQVKLPIAINSTLERYEGMRVAFSAASGDKLYVADTYTFARYGEATLYADAVPFTFTEINTPDVAGYAAYLDTLARNRIQLEDGNSAQNPTLAQLNAGTMITRDTTADNVANGTAMGVQADNSVNFIRVGDMATSVTGVLSYGFGEYELHPTETVALTTNPRPTGSPDVGAAEIKVAGMNVLNYFTTLGTASFTTPAGNSIGARGATTTAEFTQQQAKLVAAMLATGAQVFGLNEVQNNGEGPDSAMASLVNALNTAAGVPNKYAYIAGHATGSDAIRVGIVYDTTAVKPLGSAVTPDTATYTAFAANNRLPVAQTFGYLADDTKQFTLVVNHLKSKGSAAGLPGDTDQLDGQGNSTATRVEAVNQLDAWLDTNPTGATDGDYLLVGDLNSYSKETPVTTLQAKGYTLHKNAGDYSYVFDGLRGSLDHILSKGLVGTESSEVTGVTHFNINSDEQIALDYNDEFGDGSVNVAMDRNDMYKSSDHDPVVIGLKLASEAGSPAADTTAPALLSSNPADDSTTVAVGDNIVLTFSETIQLGTGAISLLDVASNTVIASDVTVSGTQLRLNPSADLAAGKGYAVQIAADAIKDLAGNAFAGISDTTTLNFTTKAATVTPPPAPLTVFISEIHYDNAGTDASEAIGIQGLAGTDLTGWSIVLYNGNVPTAATTYNATGISGAISLSGLVIDNENNSGFGEVFVNAPGMQNGSADGMALVNAAGQVVQLLSYEGVFTVAAIGATNSGPAAGMTSVDIGVFEDGNTTPVGASLQLVGGIWKLSTDDSFGSLNIG